MSAGTRGGKRSGLKGGGCDFEVLRESDTVAVLEAVAIPGIVFPGCAAILAGQTRSEPSDHILRLEAVKNASDRVGGHRGRRDFSYPFVLVHCLLGAREQFVDTYGTP